MKENFTRQLIALSVTAARKAIVDPKGLNYNKYEGVYIVKPNRKELQEVTYTTTLPSPEDIKAAARKLIEQTQSTYIVVMLSEDGIALVTANTNTMKTFPVKVNEVYDVTGAEDT